MSRMYRGKEIFKPLNTGWVEKQMPAIIDEVDTSFAAEQKKTNPRLAKYTAKYDKYRQ